ncbi:MAG: hypothetical protein AB1611_08015 [bacterium]
MKKILTILPVCVCMALFVRGTSHASTNDGREDFSIKPDVNASGALTPGQILYSLEDGTKGDDFIIPTGGLDVSGLSGHHRCPPWNHNVTLSAMIKGDYFLKYSVSGSSDVFEWHVTGPEPVPSGSGRNIAFAGVHDTDVDLGLTGQDLDALEAHDHPRYQTPYPGVPLDWENEAVHYSAGDSKVVYFGNFTSGWGKIYHIFPEAIDGLIVYDVAGGLDTFDAGTDTLNSDVIFYSLAPCATDPIGDNIYWYSAASGGIGGLYADPQLNENVDALDNRPSSEQGGQ